MPFPTTSHRGLATSSRSSCPLARPRRSMASWAELEAARPDLAAAGRALLYQVGVGLAFLGTVRRDGGPRLHPMCPLLTPDAMYAFIVPSPKQTDLRRDG